MLWGDIGHRSFRTSAVCHGRPCRCCVVALHQTWPGMLCIFGTVRPGVPETLQGKEKQEMCESYDKLKCHRREGGRHCCLPREGSSAPYCMYWGLVEMHKMDMQGHASRLRGTPAMWGCPSPSCITKILAVGRGSASACGQSCWNLSISKQDKASAMSLLISVQCAGCEHECCAAWREE